MRSIYFNTVLHKLRTENLKPVLLLIDIKKIQICAFKWKVRLSCVWGKQDVKDEDSKAEKICFFQKSTDPVSALQARLFSSCHAIVRCLEDWSVEEDHLCNLQPKIRGH